MRLIAKTFLYFFVFGAAGAYAQTQIPVKANPAEISLRGLSGRRAPSFTLPDGNMRPYDILDFRGHWLFLAYIKTDAESRNIVRKLETMKAHVGAKAAVLAVVLPPDNTATVGKFVAEGKLSTPVLFDNVQTAMWYFKASPQRPSIDTPHVFAINPQGMLVKDWNESDTKAAGFAAEVEALASGAGK